MHLHRQRGQATIEYAGIVAVVALILAGTATAIAAPWVPRRVAHTIRLGICKVGGDICDAADAKARGLKPCVVSDWDRTRTGGISVALLHIGGTDNWVVTRRSDGTRLLSYLPSFDAKASVGIGLSLGPRVHIGADASAGATFGAGKQWELPDEASLQRFIKRIDAASARKHTPWGKLSTPPARIHFQEGGFPVEAAAQVAGLGKRLGGGDASSQKILGHRTGPDGTTWYYDGGTALAGALAGRLASFDARGRVVAEWHPSPPSSITVRATTGSGNRVTETVTRLDLGRPEDRAVAGRWALGVIAPAALPLIARDLANRMAERGVTERFTYEQTERTSGFDHSIKLGKRAIGFDRGETLVRRRLVGAELITRDGTLTRADCLGLDAA